MSPTSTTPEAMLVRASNGDDAAFEDFYDICAPAVFGLARQMVGDAAISEQVACDTFVTAWSAAPDFDPDSTTALSWVLDLTHRHAVAALRDESTSPESSARRVPGLDGLPDEHRRPLMETYYGGRDYREAATRCGVSPEVMTTRIKAGMAGLAARLDSSSAQDG